MFVVFFSYGFLVLYPVVYLYSGLFSHLPISQRQKGGVELFGWGGKKLGGFGGGETVISIYIMKNVFLKNVEMKVKNYDVYF